MPKSKKVLLVYANCKYGTHIHAYVDSSGNICVRKRDTTLPERFDHVDFLRETKSKHHVGSRLITHGKSHVSDNIRNRVEASLMDLLTLAKLPHTYTQSNLKKLYDMGVR